MSRLPGVKAKHAIITPDCRKIQGGDLAAFTIASDKLEDEYMSIIKMREDREKINFHLVLTVESIKNTE